ncbi:phosphatases II [Dentipellis sp. KUC8613]|nr:phosphatases II [Dentipellis sp. KUC8613]
MDSIRVTKVSNVLCSKSSKTYPGTLHLTAHHLIFSYDDNAETEMWVPYPLIALVTRLPQTLSGQCPITFRCRTFETFSLSFPKDSDAADVFESIKELTVAISVTQLYAFFYTPNPPLESNNGWSLYSPREEFGRMGVGTRSKAWRFTDINKDYSFCTTYPARMVVPTRISDTTLQYAVKYRSKGRIPALTYLHWANYGSITRSSQPMVGLTNARSIQDEKLVEAIFQSHYSPDTRAATAPVFGATATNLIVDARPTTNAVANTAKGAGTENMDHYRDCKKAYLGIDHIHTMRESLAKVIEALQETEVLSATVTRDVPGTSSAVLPVDRQALRRSGWLRHLVAILEGTAIIVRNVHVNSSHVLIHCSDGWDRTSQLSAISQLCLDPFYRTIRGFQILIEKDWVSFGHKFLDRCGHLSSEKFFLAPVEGSGSGGGAEAAQAFFASVQNRFASNHHIKETSPVFHQFLEAVRNIQRQFPDRFEFNEKFLRDLHYHLYSCQFGTFLFNNERDRRTGDPPPCERTVAVWDYMNSEPRRSAYLNASYRPELDDPASRLPKADQGVLFPNPRDVRFWNELYGKSDEEMNGRFLAPAPAPTQAVELVGPVELAGEDSALLRPGTPRSSPLPPSPTASPSPTAPASLSASVSSDALSIESTRRTSPAPGAQRTLSPLSPVSPQRSRQTTPRPAMGDLLSTGGVGVRSVWGKLSSNASAAFSAVQGAYDGVTKDFRGLSVGASEPSGLSEKGGELRSRDELAVWGTSATGGDTSATEATLQPAARSSTYSIGSSTNPWATTSRHHDNVPSVMLDNPWNTTRSKEPFASMSTPRATSNPLGELFGGLGSDARDSGLPPDPAVAQPTSWRAPSTTGPTSPFDVVASPSTTAAQPKEVPPPKPPSPPPSQGAADPLGVGLWS